MSEQYQENLNNETNTEGREVSTNIEASSGFSTMPIFRQLAIIGSLLIGIFGLGMGALWVDEKHTPEQTASVADYETDHQSDYLESRLRFDEVEILAHSAIVIDANSGRVLYEKSPDEKWPLASITKLMTALVASELVEEDEVITVTDSALMQSGDGDVALGEHFSYRSLSDLVLLTSSNDGAYALSAYAGATLDSSSPEVAFVQAMNVRAKELGLSNTYFRNPTGLDLTEEEAGAYGTARDVAVLMNYLLKSKPEILEATTNAALPIYSADGLLHQADNTNYVVEEIPNVVASKTGYTTLAGGNLAIAFQAGLNRPVIAVVLGSTHQGRFTDMLQLVEASRTVLITNQ